MTKQPIPKFSVGELVKEKGDSDRDVGEIMAYRYTPAEGFRYQVSSTEVSIERKEIIEGSKSIVEDDLVKVEVKK